LEIGEYVTFAANVNISFLGLHSMEAPTTYSFIEFPGFPFCKEDINAKEVKIVIGNDVWIGTGAIILQNSVIGDGSIIGAYSVVRGTVAPYSVVIGNPVQEIRKRFSPATIEGLLKIKWWDWPEEKIKKNAYLLKSKEGVEKLLRGEEEK
jgi:acetyltransferase-like isoleucine patch superfamily enzyme